MNKFCFILTVLFFLEGCGQSQHGDLDFLGKFPSRLKEVSGMETDGSTFWVIQDSGNKDKIFKVDKKAQVSNEYKIHHAKNEDWEDLTLDKKGNLYIGDFGNNNNARKNLVIYKIDSSQLHKKEPAAKKIKFKYPQQHKFPPKKDSLLFDTEAFFHWNDSLYLFTKNRTRPYSGRTLIYRVPDKKGEYDAEYLGSMVLCKNASLCSVTGADISSNGKTIALLTYGMVFLVTDFELSDFSKASAELVDLKTRTQTESICFLDDNTLLIADEENRGTGRNLYSYSLKKKSKTETKPKGKP
ncbi:hypothetical protein [Flagellimonas nanhaiensis]|uniref:SdiA-regulated family protein n=1 Tax=Flagellimonas nanhaiensis TaxID=2292706 RepID=A0A371JPK8_9FLAO|nr:hypothetical protein [Allomuricauda nanhaiensis]RDY59465.1 hypothetical protein DX873_08755 [Allomuricauda nanhaiensis]